MLVVILPGVAPTLSAQAPTKPNTTNNQAGAGGATKARAKSRTSDGADQSPARQGRDTAAPAASDVPAASGKAAPAGDGAKDKAMDKDKDKDAPAATTPVPPAPDLSFPPDANKETLLKVIATAKGFRPFNPDQYKLQQTALRDASNALIKLIDNTKIRCACKLNWIR